MKQKTNARIHMLQISFSTMMTVALCSYAYLLCSSVAFAVSQKELSQESAIVTDQLATLESEYLSKSKNLSESTGQDFGLVAVSEKNFVKTSTALGRADTVSVAN